jgi:excisionase family DNA binding protein
MPTYAKIPVIPTAALPVPPGLFHFVLQYSRIEAAEMIGVSLRTLDRLIAQKQLRVHRTGRRVLINQAELVQFTKRDDPTGGVQ